MTIFVIIDNDVLAKKLVASMVLILIAGINSMIEVKWIIRLSNLFSALKGNYNNIL